MPVPCVLPGSSLLGVAYVRPLRARVVFAGLPPKGLLLLPSPGPALVGLASPGGFGSGSVRPWRSPPPGALGVPSLCFVPPVSAVFGVSVLSPS